MPGLQQAESPAGQLQQIACPSPDSLCRLPYCISVMIPGSHVMYLPTPQQDAPLLLQLVLLQVSFCR